MAKLNKEIKEELNEIKETVDINTSSDVVDISEFESKLDFNNKEVVKKVKVKLIKDLPRLYIVDDFYQGLRGDTLVVPESVAYILRGSDNTTEVYAV